MHSKTGRSALMVLLTVGVLIPTYATGGVNSGDINLVSVRQEWELGRKLAADLARKLDLVENRAAVAYLNRMGRRMSSRTELGRLPWRFHLVRDATINAYNIPGGHVYVHTGLVRAAGSAAELAGALSHEIGHGAARHGTEQLTRNYGLSLVAGLLLGEDPATYQQILTQVVAGGAMANYGRDAEREADRLGVRYMYEAGYDPNGMIRMFQRLLARRHGRPGVVARFFSSHPLTESRIRDAREEISRLPRRRGLIRNDPGFAAFKRAAR